MRKTIGILAHVDAGKTTLSEQVLYTCGVVRTPGRVDHGDASLDDDPMERQRGITIYATMARLSIGGSTVYWLDTPGHTDFTPEMERALSVMDAAVLVVSAAEGVQSHTETLWRLLEAYRVPTLIFLNKLDLAAADPEGAIDRLRARCSGDVLDLRAWQNDGVMDGTLLEEIALRDEAFLDDWEAGRTDERSSEACLARLTMKRAVFPVMAGSALSGDGVASFLRLLDRLTPVPAADTGTASGICWKVTHDRGGQRLCHVKLTGGTLSVKDDAAGEKVNDIRRWEGHRLIRADRAEAGDHAVLAGFGSLRPGDAFGDAEPVRFRTEPMISVRVLWDDAPESAVLRALRQAEEEEPTFCAEAEGGAIHIRVMGPIQLEILQTVMRERFGIRIAFGPPRVLYRETVAAPAVGIGHYEPLRHYAEVWLRLVPLPGGSGIRFRSRCHVDILPLHFQRLVETHVFEREHRGVLTGAPIDDVEIQLLIGRAHPKHTEGGDFRQATYRAVRNALMNARSVLLEPIAGFRADVPADQYGTVLSALQQAHASIEQALAEGQTASFAGEVAYAGFIGFQQGFMSLTRGRGVLRVWMARYAPCTDPGPVIASAAYDPLNDPEHPPGSVFCSHGAGFNVAWDKVRDFAHCIPEGDIEEDMA